MQIIFEVGFSNLYLLKHKDLIKTQKWRIEDKIYNHGLK